MVSLERKLKFLKKLSYHSDFAPLKVFPLKKPVLEIREMNSRRLSFYKYRLQKKIKLIEKTIQEIEKDLKNISPSEKIDLLPLLNEIPFARNIIKLAKEELLKDIDLQLKKIKKQEAKIMASQPSQH